MLYYYAIKYFIALGIRIDFFDHRYEGNDDDCSYSKIKKKDGKVTVRTVCFGDDKRKVKRERHNRTYHEHAKPGMRPHFTR